MRFTLRKLALVAFIGWFLFTSSFLYVFLLPGSQDYADAGTPVTDYIGNALKTIWNVIGQAIGKIQAGIESITAGATSFLAGHTVLKEALEVAWNVARRSLLDMLVNDIISWVQGGGKPRFVTDFPGQLTDVASNAVGAFAGSLTNMNLCSDFRLTINGLFPPRPPAFGERIACTASDIYGNFDRIWEQDFARGGWQNWLALQQPQNNVFGAYLMAQGELADQIAQKVDAKKLQIGSGQGFLGSEECTEWRVSGGTGQPTGGTFKKDAQTGKLTNTDSQQNPTRRCVEKSLQREDYAGDDEFVPNAQERAASDQKTKQIVCYDAVVDTATGKDQVDGTGNPVTVPGSEGYYNEGAEMQCESKQTLTPGAIVARSAADALNVDIPWLISSKEITAYLGAIVNAVINRVAREGLAMAQHGSGSYSSASPGWGTTVPTTFDCSRITNPELREQNCGFGSAENPYIKTAAQDPIQIIKAELPLLAQLKIDLGNFHNELGGYRDKLIQIRDVQVQVRDTEQRIINAAAQIVSAPRNPVPYDPPPIEGRIVTHSHEHGPGHGHELPEPSFPAPPAPTVHTHTHTHNYESHLPLPMPAQPGACTMEGWVLAERTAPAQQSGEPLKNIITETFGLTLRGAVPTLAPSSLDQIGNIESIGRAIITKTMRYSETQLACTERAWSSSFALNSSTPEAESALIETENKIAAIEEQRRIVQELINNVTEYRTILEKWNAGLGIQGGLITSDQALMSQALSEITPIREDVIGIGTGAGNDSGLQDLMDTTEPEFTNLTTAFISYRTNVLTETVGVETVIGNPRLPEGGGNHGLLAELKLIEDAVGQVSVSCLNPVTERVCSGEE
ncbi:MAG: hypothetical protein U1A16_04000 [Patescibacteria group bacterium]|nr:hypothetical protein [Patescibacteria group bacterium]